MKNNRRVKFVGHPGFLDKVRELAKQAHMPLSLFLESLVLDSCFNSGVYTPTYRKQKNFLGEIEIILSEPYAQCYNMYRGGPTRLLTKLVTRYTKQQFSKQML